MSKPVALTKLSLELGTSLDLRKAAGTLVSVEKGTVWITQAGDPVDTLLAAGQSFRLDRDGLAVVEALGGPASIVVAPAQSARFDIVQALTEQSLSRVVDTAA